MSSFQRVDPETLAALLDGTLPVDERARVLALLGQDGESYADFVEAAAILDALSGDPVRAGSASLTVRSRPSSRHDTSRTHRHSTRREWRKGWMLVPLLAAAGIATVLLVKPPGDADRGVPILGLMESLSSGESRAPARMASAFGANWAQRRWPVVRGRAPTLPARATAFRMGVRFAQLDLALAMRDSEAIEAISDSLVQITQGVETGAPVAGRIQHLVQRESAGAVKRERVRVATDLRILGDEPEWFDLGAWSEAGRLAAKAGRADFFAPDAPAMQELDRLLTTLDRLAPDERNGVEASMERLHDLAQRGTVAPDDLGALAAALDSTVAEGGR